MASPRHTSRTALVTDSAAALSPEQVAYSGVRVAAMTLRIDEATIVDSPGTDYAPVYRALRPYPDMPAVVSAPLPDVWRTEIIAAAARPGIECVLLLTMSAQFAASYDSARIGAELAMRSDPRIRVKVLDSDAVSGAQAIVCLAAADAANSGSDLATVVATAKSAAQQVRTVAMLSSLDQVHRIGRIPTMALQTARTLGVKPLVRFDSSGWKVLARPISRRSGLAKLVSTVCSSLPEGTATRIVVMHVDAEPDAGRVAERMAELRPDAEVNVSQMHPFAGIPAGTGTVGVAWLGGEC